MTKTNDLIRTLRENSGASQASVAEKLGMARATYAALEEGREPKLGEIQKLSEFYNISADDLILGEHSEDNSQDQVDFDIVPTELARDRSPELDAEKLREVLLYLTNKISSKANVGETVLYKMLYFIDFDYYEKTGHSITGLTYKKLAHGPVPKQQSFLSVISEMKRNNDLEIVSTQYFSHNQKKYLPKKTFSELPETKLSAKELEHINWEIERLSDQSATQLSEFSHQDTPWLAAKMNEKLNYQHVFYRTPVTAVTEDEDEL